jgi:uroporphyrinogen-III synthase
MPASHSGAGPLAGLRIVHTRPHEQSGSFEERIRALGGIPEIAPAIAIAPPADPAPLDAAVAHLGEFDWIAFTSANAVRAVADRAEAAEVGRDAFVNVRLAAVGLATADALAQTLRAPDFVAQVSTARSLGEELPLRRGERVLVPRGDLAQDAFADGLAARGATPYVVPAYRTVPGPGIPQIIAGLRAGTTDALLFASGSAVRFVADAVDDAVARSLKAGRPAIFCIGPSTARAAESVGFAPAAIASAATQDALIDAVAEWFSARQAGDA